MSNFVLSSVSAGVWTGKSKAKVTISVRSANNNATKIHDAAYPDDTAITVSNNESNFLIADDQKSHTLNIAIIPPPVPDNWNIVEIGEDGSTQVLADFLAGDSVGSIEIKPE